MSNHETTFNPEQHAGVAPTATNYDLVRLHQILADLEAITFSVELGAIMPTPDAIVSLAGFAERMRVQAQAAGLEFPERGEMR